MENIALQVVVRFFLFFFWFFGFFFVFVVLIIRTAFASSLGDVLLKYLTYLREVWEMPVNVGTA